MPRSGKIEKRQLLPDPIYGSKLLSRFINRAMMDGKKSTAQRQIYGALTIIEEKFKKNPITVFETALANVAPKMEVRPRRVGGASYQVPVEVRGDRREALAIRWLIMAARSKSAKEYHSFAEKLSVELVDASENKGLAIKKKEDTLRSAEANKAFSHFKWG
ncbi:MAG: 30S ribosomal protein S7 [Candidatus Daviesbacteria bacterium]|nr:30S ribosomal protein S7 [Candidatus Daviesbacteria bacterium]